MCALATLDFRRIERAVGGEGSPYLFWSLVLENLQVKLIHMGVQ